MFSTPQLSKHIGSKKWVPCLKTAVRQKQGLYRLEALYRKPSFSIAFIISSKTKKYFCALTFYKATWLAYRERWFKWVTAIWITLIVLNLRTFGSMRLSRVKYTLGCADRDWAYWCIFTLPTPPMQKNCHSHYFLDGLRAFPPPFGQSPSGLPITEGLLFDA